MPLVLPGIYQFSAPMEGPLKSANYYLLQDNSKAYLLDTGIQGDEALTNLVDQLAAIGLSPADLDGVILTHAHRDHCGLAAALCNEWQIPLWMHRIEADYVRSWYIGSMESGLGDTNSAISRNSTVAELLTGWTTCLGLPGGIGHAVQQRLLQRSQQMEPFIPDRFLAEGDLLEIAGSTWQVLWTPGHAPGHICLWDAARRILISGDHLLPNLTPHIGALPGMDPHVLSQYIKGLDRVAHLSANLALPGHGDPFETVSAQAEFVIAHHDQRLNDIVAACTGSSALTAFEIACKIPWTGQHKSFLQLPTFDQQLAITETMAHINHLGLQKRLVAVEAAKQPILYRLPH